ncbi:hypothetical protein [Nocardiopsis lucentensis]|uniref:hypothetical protein n=1 Tax=Nocardiopsis lucentensis TaxID=53441 RepID=UPI00373AF00F
MERARPTTPFPRWSSPITRPEPESHVSLADLRRRGWTVWFGRHTRQYWAAHTGRMRLVCANTTEGLIRTITQVDDRTPG